jgi:hypothetical protein
MPNWTSCTLKIKGKKPNRLKFADELAQFIRNKHRMEDENGEPPTFDFNFAVQMPDELHNTQAPRPESISEVLNKSRNYNWDNETLKFYIGLAISDEEASRLDDLKNRFGYDNWLDWCEANWGTKSNAAEAMGGPTETPSMTVYYFKTAWSPPEPIVHALAYKYPDLQFRLEFEVEGMSGRNHIIGSAETYELCFMKNRRPN